MCSSPMNIQMMLKTSRTRPFERQFLLQKQLQFQTPWINFEFLSSISKNVCIWYLCSNNFSSLRKALPLYIQFQWKNQWNVLVTASKFDPVIIASSAGIICNWARLRNLLRSYRTKFDSTPYWVSDQEKTNNRTQTHKHPQK